MGGGHHLTLVDNIKGFCIRKLTLSILARFIYPQLRSSVYTSIYSPTVNLLKVLYRAVGSPGQCIINKYQGKERWLSTKSHHWNTCPTTQRTFQSALLGYSILFYRALYRRVDLKSQAVALLLSC